MDIEILRKIENFEYDENIEKLINKFICKIKKNNGEKSTEWKTFLEAYQKRNKND